MGVVISFPVSQRQRAGIESENPREPGQVVILPAIRIERTGEQPGTGVHAPRAPGRKRRRRVRS